ncbi:NUDIX hydrolase [Streptomyces sp. L500]
MGSSAWQRRQSRTLYTGGPRQTTRLTVDQAVRPDGRTIDYPYAQVPESVRVLAVHGGRIPLVRQHIYLHSILLQDLPGGMIETGEEPHDAARRELAEETGLTAGFLHPLGTVVTARSACTEKAHLYLAHDCTPGPPATQPGEALETAWCTWHELTTSAGANGEPADAASLAAILRASTLLHRLGGALPDGGDLARASWAAHTAIATRPPQTDDHLMLCWLDLALGTYAEGSRIVQDADRSRRSTGWDAAWHQTLERLTGLVR